MYPRSPHGSVLLGICEIKIQTFEDDNHFLIENFEIKKKIKKGRRALYPRSPHGSVLLRICEIKSKLFEDKKKLFIENFEIK